MVAGDALGQRVNHAFKAIARRLNEAEFRQNVCSRRNSVSTVITVQKRQCRSSSSAVCVTKFMGIYKEPRRVCRLLKTQIVYATNA